MRTTIGGGGRERWLFLLPSAALAITVMFWFGGPQQALNVVEHMTYEAWRYVAVLWRN